MTLPLTAALFLSAVMCVALVGAYNNGVGALPPMGWNTWCTDDACGLIDKCSDAEVRQQARAVVDSGMKAAGYEYINMDDCWNAKTRDANGNLQPDANRFPKGMKALADYIHSLGLKIGLYTCIGKKTCKNGLPGSWGHYEQDAKRFAEWGIDFVKCDNCDRPGGYTEEELYTNFSKHLNATGRPILFSLCEWGDQSVQNWGAKVGQMYRIQMDHLPFWYLPAWAMGKGFGQGVINIVDYVATINPASFVKPYGWMDTDFLMTLFRPTMNYQYSKVEFTMWSMWSAPLIMASNAHNMTEEKRSIVLNKEIIALDQDALATAATEIYHNNKTGGRIWTKPLANGDLAVAFLNGNDLYFDYTDVVFNHSWTALGIKGQVSKVRDLWRHRDVTPVPNGTMVVSVPAADIAAFRVSCGASSKCY